MIYAPPISDRSHAERLLGIDVSGWQRPIDWESAVRFGVTFCWVKSSESRQPAKRYELHTLAARQEGVITGPYHFARMNTKGGKILSATEQMEAWRELAHLWRPGLDLPPALDCEFGGVRMRRHLKTRPTGLPSHVVAHRFKDRETGEAYWNTYLAPMFVADWMEEAFEAADRLFGRKVALYAGPSFWGGFVKESRPNFLERPLWTVDYGKDDIERGQPDPFGPWDGDWTFWQQSGSWRPEFYDGKLDRNVFNGGLDELLALCGVSPCVETALRGE